jgi:hypothetical protein
MSHADVYVMCQPKVHDVFVTWHDAVVSDIIFQVFRHVGRRHVRWGSSCTVMPIIEHYILLTFPEFGESNIVCTMFNFMY